ncbi:secreted RxLR effector protein 161-like [Nicotiana sylvestris]|uniref:secreted RxLR effector protein 161-like n=1 Tax=Nicotiana sylvestris TaxID=4096 RepID=UPI00388C8A2F
MVLEKFKHLEFKSVRTPIDLNHHLEKNKGDGTSQLDYARVLGSLMYIMNCTRPDIACAISKLSRFTSNPNKHHWVAMKRVLGYLEYTQDYALYYNKYLAVIEGYSDTNWITGVTETKSTSGYVFTVGGGAVSWKSSKHTCIARSTMESEFIALDKAGEEAEWLRNFLEDIPFWPNLWLLYAYIAIVRLQQDGHGALCITESLVICDEDIKPLDNYSLMELSLLIM